jgi:bifunctional DNA-binding transcriptional regulator/antitoxin component of YhaV-PrlF toxin-antitoxin module
MARKPPGFAEEQAKFTPAPALPAPALEDRASATTEARLKIGPGGRVIIPADMRAALGADEGDTLLASLADGELRLVSTPTAIRRAQAIVRAYIPAGGPSVVDELIADRRAEAAAEEAWAAGLPQLGNANQKVGRK